MSVIGDGIDILKLVDKGHNAALYKQIGEWIEKVADLQRDKDELSTEVAALREQLRFKSSFIRVSGHAYVDGDDEEICPRCAEVDRIPVHLLMTDYSKPPFVRAICPSCKTVGTTPRPLMRSEIERG